MGKITKDMLVIEALNQGNREAIAQVFFDFGLHCFGCAAANKETVEEAAQVHGVDLNEMLKKLNEAAKKK